MVAQNYGHHRNDVSLELELWLIWTVFTPHPISPVEEGFVINGDLTREC